MCKAGGITLSGINEALEEEGVQVQFFTIYPILTGLVQTRPSAAKELLKFLLIFL